MDEKKRSDQIQLFENQKIRTAWNGESKEWVYQRLLVIRIRNEFTDEISRARSGVTTRQYKQLKGLKKENLRENVSDLKLLLNMLVEASTTSISKTERPEGS